MTNQQPLPEAMRELSQRWKTAPARVLALDYDGTLARFQPERMDARPLAGVVESLTTIAHCSRTRVLLVSGRPLHELCQLMPSSFEMIGGHGSVHRLADGTVSELIALAEHQAALDAAEQSLATLGDVWPAVSERKRASVALHTRKVEPLQAEQLHQRVLAVWAQLEARGLQPRAFDGGVETRVMGVDKGSALAKVLGQPCPGQLEIFIGDDDTDEDAIRVVQQRGGIGGRVGNATSMARLRLADCAAVARLLEQLAE